MLAARPTRPAPVLSPATAKEIVEAFTNEYASSSSDSPDSLYSSGSPTLPEQSFEYDDEEVSHHDEAEYESLMAEGDSDWGAPAWGRWPESTGTGPGWSRGMNRSDSASIISLSPHGSQVHSLSSRRGSLAKGKRASLADSRRDSDPSLLGFNLTPTRRRSSNRSGSLNRRRSSALSSTFNDSAEENRLRAMASLDALGRRFSEVVEVTVPSDEEDHTAMAGAAISAWSPYSASSADDDTDSEIHTAPYFPTPDMPRTMRTLLSNFPLSSVAADGTPATSWSDVSAANSPAMMPLPRRLPYPLHQPSAHFVATPPPPTAPSALLRERVRPHLGRFSTNWEVEHPRSIGVPPGAAAPRPRLGRSISTPFFGAGPTGRAADAFLQKRAAGSFPIGRELPLGRTPLRESLRRQSIVSDGPESRRQSIAQIESRRQSLADTSRRQSLADLKDSRRSSITDGASILAERRASLLREGLRRKSIDVGRRSSTASRKESTPSRRESTASRRESIPSRRDSIASRKGSISSLAMSLSNVEMRRDSGSSRRKSSVVSITEYGYLGPQIEIDVVPTEAPSPTGQPRLRSNAPAAIVIPEYTFPASPTQSLVTPRQFHPIDAFLGRDSTPTAERSFASAFPFDEASPNATPMLAHATPRPTSIMDRPRPISPPEFADYLLPKPRLSSIHGSPRSVPDTSSSVSSHSNTVETVTVTPIPPAEVVIPLAQSAIVRKAVPQITAEELRVEEARDKQLRRERSVSPEWHIDPRGGIMTFDGDEVLKTGNHRRTISVQPAPVIAKRPVNRRQATLPVELEAVSPAGIAKRRSQLSFHTPNLSVSRTSSESSDERSPSLREKVIRKRSSVTFADPSAAKEKNGKPILHRASSFSRFFHSKPKTPTISAPVQVKPLRPSIRPISVDSGSSGSDRTLVEMREAFKKFSRESD